MPSHTAKVGLPEVGSEHPVGIVSGNLAGRPGHLRFRLQAGWPLGPTLAAVAVDSAPGPPHSGFRRPNRGTGRDSKTKGNKHPTYIYIYAYFDMYMYIHLSICGLYRPLVGGLVEVSLWEPEASLSEPPVRDPSELSCRLREAFAQTEDAGPAHAFDSHQAIHE